ncbi:MAG: PAS domain-containing protein [Limisphaerales bacterium]
MAGPIKLLLIEDDPIDQMAFRRKVKAEQLHYEYEVTDLVSEAEHLLDGIQFDIVISDINLPDGTFFDLQEHLGDIPVIVTTGGGDEAIAVRAMKAGAFDYLIKDQDQGYLQILPLRVEAALRQREDARELRESRERLDLALGGADLGLWDWRIDTNKLEVNDRWLEMLDYEREDFDGTLDFWEKLIHPEDLPILESRTKDHFKGLTNAYENEQRLKTKGGKWKRVLSRARIVERDEEGKPLRMAGTHLDVNRRRLTENALRDAKAAAESANLAKGNFLATMSHEIRTPMNGILGMVNLALKTELDERQRRYLHAAQHSASDLLTIIDDILDFSKIEAGKFELSPVDFDLRETIARCLKPMAIRAHEKLLDFNFRIAPDVPDQLHGDPVRLRQIITNLIGNAIKFTDKGEVLLNLRMEPSDTDKARLYLTVSDTGTGIPTAKQEEIFWSLHAGRRKHLPTLRRHGAGIVHLQNARPADEWPHLGGERTHAR